MTILHAPELSWLLELDGRLSPDWLGEALWHLWWQRIVGFSGYPESARHETSWFEPEAVS